MSDLESKPDFTAPLAGSTQRRLSLSNVALPAPTIALPNETPAPLDLSTIPDHLLRSGAVETLIGQNEDLMARLKVNLRRLAHVERQLLELEQAASDLRRINASLATQTLILSEKESGLRERAQSAEEARDLASRRLRALENFYRRVAKWAKPRLKRAVRAEQALFVRDAEMSSMKRRLDYAIERAQEIESSRARDQATLVEAYETKIAELSRLADSAASERQYFKERSDRLDEVRARAIASENEAILQSRRSAELEAKFQAEADRLLAETTAFRKEAKKLAVEVVGLTDDRKRLQAERDSLAGRLERCEDQFESLRVAWADAQKKRETLESRNEALGRINNELSKKLRVDRESETKTPTPPPLREDSFAKIDSILMSLHGLDFQTGTSPAPAATGPETGDGAEIA